MQHAIWIHGGEYQQTSSKWWKYFGKEKLEQGGRGQETNISPQHGL